VPPPDLGLGPYTATLTTTSKLGFLSSAAGAWTTGLALAAVITTLAVTTRTPTPETTPISPTPGSSELKAASAIASAPISPPAPPIAAPARDEPTTDTPDPLAAELALLEAARAALLADDPHTALEQLTRHRRRFPDGALAQEAATTRIDALCRQNNLDAAQREAEAFARRWPRAAPVDPPCEPKK
jgi:hypothetical protein